MRKLFVIILLSVCLPTIITAQKAGGNVVRKTQKVSKPATQRQTKHYSNVQSVSIDKNKLKGASVVYDGMKYEFFSGNGWWVLSKGKDSSYVKIRGTINYNGETFTVKQIYPYAFRNMQKVEKVDISEGIVLISPGAFGGCTKLNDIHFPKSLRKIYEKAFYNCTSLKHISFNSTKIHLSHAAFYNSWIVSIQLPEEFSMNNNAFMNCSQLQEIIVNKKNKEYDSRNNCNAIIYTKDNRLVAGCNNTQIPADIRTIDYYAFAGSNLTSVNIPEGVEEIGMAAFSDCKQLKDVRFPQSLKKIGDRAFYGCDIEDSVKIPNRVAEISSKAFASNRKLKLAHIPVSCKVEDNAFDEHVQIIRY